MSSLPDIHVDLLAQIAPLAGMTLRETEHGFSLDRDGQSFRFEVFDEFVSGSVLREACRWLDVDPSKLATAITANAISG